MRCNGQTRRAPWAAVAVVLVIGLASMSGGVALGSARQDGPAATSQPCPTWTAAGEACLPSGELAEELPPPDLPTTNEQGYRFTVEATLTADLAAVPTEAPVYALERTVLSAEQAADLADRLNIDAEPEDRGNGVYVFSGDGELFVTPDVVQYLSAAEPEAGELPNDEAAIAAAREWLRRLRLAPADLGAGRVASRTEDAARLVVVFAPEEPANLLAAFPSITVSLGPEGEVLEASLRWAAIRRADLYQLQDAEDAWFRVEASQVYLEADLAGAGLEQGTEVTGTVEYTDIDLVYTTAGQPSGTRYLEPVFVFAGQLSLAGRDRTFPIKAYVPALAGTGAPVGRVGGIRS